MCEEIWDIGLDEKKEKSGDVRTLTAMMATEALTVIYAPNEERERGKESERKRQKEGDRDRQMSRQTGTQADR